MIQSLYSCGLLHCCEKWSTSAELGQKGAGARHTSLYRSPLPKRQRHAAGPAVTFAVDFEHRSCDKLKRGEVVDVVAKAVPAPPHRVDLKAPEKTLVVQLVRNVCALGVVSEFRRLARMNLRKLAEDEGEETANGSGPQSACTAKAEVTLV